MQRPRRSLQERQIIFTFLPLVPARLQELLEQEAKIPHSKLIKL